MTVITPVHTQACRVLSYHLLLCLSPLSFLSIYSLLLLLFCPLFLIGIFKKVYDQGKPVFYLASRGHHADIGGISPGTVFYILCSNTTFPSLPCPSLLSPRCSVCFPRLSPSLACLLTLTAPHLIIVPFLGSMPPFSRSLEEEGACIKSFKLVKNGVFQEKELTHILTNPGAL